MLSFNSYFYILYMPLVGLQISLSLSFQTICVVFDRAKILIYLFFLLWIVLPLSNLRTICLAEDRKIFFLCFLSKCFTFTSIVHFLFNFCIRCEVQVGGPFLASGYSITAAPFINNAMFPPLTFAPLSKISFEYVCVFISGFQGTARP